MSEVQLGIVILAVTTFILFSGVPVAFGLTIVSVGFLAMLEGAASLTVLPRTFIGCGQERSSNEVDETDEHQQG